MQILGQYKSFAHNSDQANNTTFSSKLDKLISQEDIRVGEKYSKYAYFWS